MKAHALRYGKPQRRATKRASDLYDIVRLTTSGTDPLLAAAPWALRAQVREALDDDLADLPAAAASLASSPVEAIRDISLDLLEVVTAQLLARLASQGGESADSTPAY